MENKQGLKVINYRGGLVTFRIPIHWVEEYEPNGGGTFYEDSPDTGTLRLSVVTLKAPPNTTGNVAFNALANLSDVDPSQIRVLSSNRVLAKSLRHSSENGKEITFYLWWLASAGDGGVVRIANFSFTILKSQANNEIVLRELDVVQREIENSLIYSGPLIE